MDPLVQGALIDAPGAHVHLVDAIENPGEAAVPTYGELDPVADGFGRKHISHGPGPSAVTSYV